jgi:uncharacterized membrane protein
MLPVVELRGGVPLAVGMGLEPQIAIPLCVLANMIPIIPVIVCIQHILRWMRHHGKTMRRFAILLQWRVTRHRKVLDRYAWMGLMLLTAIPIPGTGAWTASMLAGLTGVRIRYAFPAIAMGVVLASLIMGILSYGVAVAV